MSSSDDIIRAELNNIILDGVRRAEREDVGIVIRDACLAAFELRLAKPDSMRAREVSDDAITAKIELPRGVVRSQVKRVNK